MKLCYSIVAVLVIVGLFGCSGGAGDDLASDPCFDSETGNRIVLQNSGLSCSEAAGIYFLLTKDTKQLQEIHDGQSTWLCRASKRSNSAVRFRCSLNARHFAVMKER